MLDARHLEKSKIGRRNTRWQQPLFSNLKVAISLGVRYCIAVPSCPDIICVNGLRCVAHRLHDRQRQLYRIKNCHISVMPTRRFSKFKNLLNRHLKLYLSNKNSK